MLKVACPQQALLESVGIVSRGVSGRSTQPVQNNIYLEARGSQLRLLATDLEYLSLEAVLDADVVEEGATTVPARSLRAADGPPGSTRRAGRSTCAPTACPERRSPPK